MLEAKLDAAFIEKGFWNGGYYVRYATVNEEEREIDSFAEEFLLNEGAYNVKTDITEAFDSPGYTCYMLSVAWVDEDGLHLETWLLEVC